jgi:hypothetical protein
MVLEFDCEQMRVSGCNGHYEFVLGAGTVRKNRDKQLPFIVRVTMRFLFYHDPDF